jgi:transcriptional regulator of met regulon
MFTISKDAKNGEVAIVNIINEVLKLKAVKGILTTGQLDKARQEHEVLIDLLETGKGNQRRIFNITKGPVDGTVKLYVNLGDEGLHEDINNVDHVGTQTLVAAVELIAYMVKGVDEDIDLRLESTSAISAKGWKVFKAVFGDGIKKGGKSKRSGAYNMTPELRAIIDKVEKDVLAFIALASRTDAKGPKAKAETESVICPEVDCPTEKVFKAFNPDTESGQRNLAIAEEYLACTVHNQGIVRESRLETKTAVEQAVAIVS